MRVFSKVDEEGRIPIPANIRREAGLKASQLVEVKVQGPKKAQYIIIKARKGPR